MSHEDIDTWGHGLPFCAWGFMVETLGEVADCESYTDPSCFCESKSYNTILGSSELYDCIDTSCSLSRAPCKNPGSPIP